MHLHRIWLTDFRSYPSLDVELPVGLTAVLGPNGCGKSNLLEGVGYLAMLRSFRGAPAEALVGVGSQRAVTRGELFVDGRTHLVEAEISRSGRNRVLLDRQRLSRRRDLVSVVRCTVFAPDDLELVKGSPSGRRGLLDDVLVAMHPRYDAVRVDWERSLRQRNALLRQLHGRADDAALVTLDVWDHKCADAGDELVRLRSELTARMSPFVVEAYQDVAGEQLEVGLAYVSTWRRRDDDDGGGLLAALVESRSSDVRRGVTLVGPHRDELELTLRRLPARTHASQGEQRSLALALRLATHRLLAEIHGTPPLLLLDDVFSELDPGRSAALLRSLPEGQTLLSSAVGLPDGVDADLVLQVHPGGVDVMR
ncbi:MAG: DNA replication/repair protein RecF [Actinobacteria bacterium]|nr:DNA replication/repair protein RecF [Actinomycetota bacterium]